jgi:hypothetical protein
VKLAVVALVCVASVTSLSTQQNNRVDEAYRIWSALREILVLIYSAHPAVVRLRGRNFPKRSIGRLRSGTGAERRGSPRTSMLSGSRTNLL